MAIVFRSGMRRATCFARRAGGATRSTMAVCAASICAKRSRSPLDMNEPLLTLIPARGGSKGLPGKNARILRDVPLVTWSYFAWKEAGLPGRCWLSTDDEELAQIGRKT